MGSVYLAHAPSNLHVNNTEFLKPTEAHIYCEHHYVNVMPVTLYVHRL